MNRLFLSIILCFSLLLPTVQATQQKQATPPKPKPSVDAEKKEPEKKELEKKEPEKKDEKAAEAELSPLQQRGLGLARQVGDDAVGLEDKRGVARVQVAAADLLWARDEEVGRKFFQRAFDAACAYYRESKDDNIDHVGSRATVARQDVRLEVIRAASSHDAAFARELTNKYVEEKQREYQEKRNQSGTATPTDNPMFGRIDASADDLIQTASSLLGTDLKMAVELTQRALALGVTQSMPGFLAQLAGRNRAAADQVYLFGLDRLLANSSATAGQLLLLGAYPFGEGQVLVSDGNNTQGLGFGAPKNFQIDLAIVNRFLTTAMTVMARTVEMNPAEVPDKALRAKLALFTGRVLEPKVTQYKPEMMEPWRELEGQLAAATDPQASNYINQVAQQAGQNQNSNGPLNPRGSGGPSLDSNDRIKSLLDQAQQTSDFNRRDSLYYSAASIAVSSGEVARALGIVDRISNLDFRRQVRDFILFDAAQRAAQEKQLDEARKYALDVSATDQRAYLLASIARVALAQKDRQRAVELLEEAAQKAIAADNTANKMRALLSITHLYASFDSIRAFEIMTEAVRAANKVPHYGVDDARLVRVLESPGSNGSTSVNSSTDDGFDLGKTLKRLASTDFDRALLLAQSLDSKTLKLAAMVAVASAPFEKKDSASR